MFCVYILFSELIQEYYCGQTKDIKDRLKRHNSGETQSIKHGIPWKLIGFIVFDKRAMAVRLEKSIKKRGIGRWLDSNYNLLQLG